MRSNIPIDDKLLQSIGIDKIGHRMRLLAKFNEESRQIALGSPKQKAGPPRPQDILICGGMPAPAPMVATFPTLQDWLENNSMGEYIHGFFKAGFDDLEQILYL